MHLSKRNSTFLISSILVLLLVCTASEPNRKIKIKNNYLSYVEKFAQTLISKGRDNYGKKTPLWCAVLDTRDFSAPRKDVPPTEGTRAGDRALGGSNLYHDITTIKTFQILSKVTGKPMYNEAGKDYIKSYLDLCQNPTTGLLGWGEHVYYDIYKDSVDIEHTYKNSPWGGYWHELLEITPPWEELWEADQEKAAKAISGLQFHFFKPQPDTFLYNRHAYWNKAQYQKKSDSQPWLKHSGLYAHSFMYLYSKTKDPQWLNYSKGIGRLYYDNRNPTTNLTVQCIGDPREFSQKAALTSTAQVAYWIYKAWQLNPQEPELREQALSLFKSNEKYAWNDTDKNYYVALNLDGSPFFDQNTTQFIKPWVTGYGTGNIFNFGRVAIYFAKLEKNSALLSICLKAEKIIGKQPIPENFVADNIGDAIHFYLDLFELTGEKKYQNQATKFADLAIKKLWKNDFFVRQTNDVYYEAKLGIGKVVSGLLRLHLSLENKKELSAITMWSY